MIHKMANEFDTPNKTRSSLTENTVTHERDTVDERLMHTAALMLLKISDAADTFIDAEAQT